MTNARATAVREIMERQQAYQTDPWSANPLLLPPCEVKILIVTDGFAFFGVSDFGMRALRGILAVPPGPWVRFRVTTAHRRNDPDADMTNFRFDTTDLSEYDQIWLFGVERASTPRFHTEITDAELRAIAQFMDGGGGVFAAGDHEDLGVAMCGRIPRVRNMRKWYWPDPGPNGEPVAPKVDGPDRNDTLSTGNDPGVQFNDQSDDIPQRITPRFYSSGPWNPYFHRSYPHPLLCGPRGVIRVLPDHPHEGECYEPTDLGASFTFDGYTTTEYPTGAAPEVIAWSTITGGRTDNDVKGALNPQRYGAIGAYDGHRAGVGRVAVDATWHHFFDVNLIGELNNPDPIKGIGFNATPAGQAAYEDIKAYYRNIVVWLAPEAIQKRMWECVLWWIRCHHVLAMDLRPSCLAEMTNLDMSELLRIGREARDVLTRTGLQCTVHSWLISHVLRPQFPQVWEGMRLALDPWEPITDPPAEPSQEPDLVNSAHSEMLIDTLLGAAVYGVGAQYPAPDEQSRSLAESTGLADTVTAHLAHACAVFATHTRQQAEKLGALPGLISRDTGNQG